MKPSHVVASRATTIKCPAARRATTRHKSVRGDVSGNNKKNREETGLEKNRQVVAAKRNEGRDGLTGEAEGEGKKGMCSSSLRPPQTPSPSFTTSHSMGEAEGNTRRTFFPEPFLASPLDKREREREGGRRRDDTSDRQFERVGKKSE